MIKKTSRRVVHCHIDELVEQFLCLSRFRSSEVMPSGIPFDASTPPSDGLTVSKFRISLKQKPIDSLPFLAFQSFFAIRCLGRRTVESESKPYRWANSRSACRAIGS